jgi:heme-degrading monooxygenase HmoA
MYARVSTVHGSPENVDEGIQQFRDGALPVVQQAQGFKGALLLVDRHSGNGLGISLWDTEENMNATEEAVRGVREEATRAMGGDAPTVDRYEVPIFEL